MVIVLLCVMVFRVLENIYQVSLLDLHVCFCCIVGGYIYLFLKMMPVPHKRYLVVVTIISCVGKACLEIYRQGSITQISKARIKVP